MTNTHEHQPGSLGMKLPDNLYLHKFQSLGMLIINLFFKLLTEVTVSRLIYRVTKN